MRVFSVEMLVKEEGAAVVEAALKRLKNEANAVATQMKVTTSNVTNTGKAMKEAGDKTEIAKDRAAKAAIGFAAVGQSIARTGSLTADAGTRIVEAGSQIATMFGPKGFAVAAVLSFAAFALSKFRQSSVEAEEMAKKFEESLARIANAGDKVGILQQMRDLELGVPAGALDSVVDINDGLGAVRQRIAELKASGFTTFNRANREELERLSEALATGEKNFARLRTAMEAPMPTTGGAAPITISAAAPEKGGSSRADRLPSDVRFSVAAREARERLLAEMQDFYRNQYGPSQLELIDAATRANAEKVKKSAAESIARVGIDISKMRLAPTLPAPEPLTDEQVQAFERAMRLDDIKETLGDGIASSIEGGITSGLEMAIASGNIADGFKAMGQAIIQSMASAMVKVALKAIAFASKMKAIQSFMASHPALALASAVALLAIARAAGGGAGGADMVATGGPSGLTYSAAGVSSGATSQIIFGSTSATTAAGMQPRSATNVTIIGPNDPTAQRAMQELMAKANSRGRVG